MSRGRPRMCRKGLVPKAETAESAEFIPIISALTQRCSATGTPSRVAAIVTASNPELETTAPRALGEVGGVAGISRAGRR
jgi:hypothetical protein